MKTVSSALGTHLEGPTTSLATIWTITRTDGQVFRFTDHDVDVPFEGEVYGSSVGYTRSAVDNEVGLSVDNLETVGFLDADSLEEAELRAGLFDFAEVRISVVNWKDLSQGQLRMRRGKLGEVIYSEVTGTFKAELRGLTQLYSQRPVELYQAECRADLGDARCKVELFPGVVRGNTAYASGNVVRGSPSLDSLAVETLLVPADEDADDVSANGFSGSLGTQAQVQAVTRKFGAGAIEFSPSGSVDPSQAFVSYADDPALSLGSGAFTIEAWVRFKDLTDANQTIASHYLNTGDQRAWILNRNGGNLDLFLSDDGTSAAPATTVSGAFAWAIDTWYHVAATRDGSGDVRLFVDGTQVGSTASVPFAVHNSTAPVRIGKLRSAGFDDNPLFGFVDDFRLTVGAALYTAGFTPPASAHVPIETTIAGLATEDFEDVVYDVTTAGTTGAEYPDFDPAPGNTTAWGTAVFTAREAFTRAATVAAVTDNRVFTVSFPNGADSREVDDWFKYGAVKWDTGANAGLTMEVKGFVASTDEVTLFLAMPFDVQVGDKLSMYAGCDKRLTTCINKFDNVLNFRGEPYVPGQDEFLNYPNAR